MKTPFTVLIVDDDASSRQAMRRALSRRFHRVLLSPDGLDALAVLEEHNVDLVLLDWKMPGLDGFDVLREVLTRRPGLKVIMLTAHGGVQEAVAAVKLGALDFVEKSSPPELLLHRVEQVHKTWELECQNQELRNSLESRFTFDELRGESPPMLQLKALVARIGPTDATVLIQGESGTGKELIARALHEHNQRKRGPFVAVDCAALSPTVVETEFFGHVKGAFTGAVGEALGLIRSAAGGTLFLDEVGELSLGMQAKLLRTIQERAVRPVGSTQTIAVDLRVVAATNRDLPFSVSAGEFRRDLYYRLSAVTLHPPALRDRVEDIPLLCRHILEQLRKEEGLTGQMVSPEALAVLRMHSWPGNVRELENVLRGAAALAPNPVISPFDLYGLVVSPRDPTMSLEGDADLASYEESAIRSALERTAGSRREAARLLGMSEATLYRRLKRYDAL